MEGQKMRRLSYFQICCLLALSAVSCSSMGHKTIPRDQFDYNTAISNSWKEQMLLNMVRLRYGEAPMFLDVATIIAQYSLEGEVALTGGLNTSFLGDDTLSLGGRGRWYERPTVTYAPRIGRKFTRSILTPPPPSAIFFLFQGGWPADLVLGLNIRSINGVAKTLPDRSPNPAFSRILGAFTRLQDAGEMVVRQELRDRQLITHMSFQDTDPDPEFQAALSVLQQQLRLPKDIEEFEVVFGRLPTKGNEIAVLTSSVLEMLIELGVYFEVPPEHVEAGWTNPTSELTSEDLSWRAPIRVKATKERPERAFVAVKNRGYWFWIDEADFRSKSRFSFLMILLSLAESGEEPAGPAVTISTGSQ